MQRRGFCRVDALQVRDVRGKRRRVFAQPQRVGNADLCILVRLQFGDEARVRRARVAVEAERLAHRILRRSRRAVGRHAERDTDAQR